MISKVMYFHYQRSLRDGSHVHTQEFESAFRRLCATRNIAFSVVAPTLETGIGRAETVMAKVRHFLAKMYLRDFSILLSQWRHARREQAILQEERPDIVLTRFDDNTLSIIWACKREKIPVVIEINAPDDENSGQYRRLAWFKRLFSNAHAIQLSDGGFAVSDQVADPVRPFALGQKPFVTIPNGVDTDRFRPAISGSEVRLQHAIPRDRVVLGFVGSFAPWHGLDMLVEAVTRLLKEDLPVHLLLVGQANPKWQALIDQVRGPGLKQYVTLSGFVAPEDIPGYIAAMDITVLPNAADYCSPLKLFEYMSMAKPTVAVGIAPVAAMLANGIEGALFLKGNVDELTARLRELVVDGESRQRLGAAARTRMVNEFTWHHNAERVFGLLERVLQTTPNPSSGHQTPQE
jgi:glycosyltransferase involved in cell wall biosynthesis